MAQIIGDTSLEGGGLTLNATRTKLFEGAIHEVILQPGQKLVEYGVAWSIQPVNGTGSGTVRPCLYDLDSKAIIPGTEVTINYNGATLTAAGVDTHLKATGLNVDLSAHAGKRIGIGLAGPSLASNSGMKVKVRTYTGAKRHNGELTQTTNPSVFQINSTTNDSSWAVYALTQDLVPPSVSLDGITPNPATNASTLTIVLTGNASEGEVSLTDGALTVLLTVSSWTYSAGTNKTTIVAGVTQGGLQFGSIEVVIEPGNFAAINGDIVLNPVAGSAYRNITAPQNGAGYIFEQLESGSYLDVTQVEYTDSPNTSVSAQGAITQTIVRPFQARARDGSDSTWGAFATIVPAAVAQPLGVVGQGVIGVVVVSSLAVARPAGVAGQAKLGVVDARGGAIAKPIGVAAVGRVGLVGSSQSAVATPQGVSGVAMLGVVTASGEVVPALARPSGVRGVGRVGFFLRVSPPVTVGSFVIPDITVIGATAFIEKVEGDTRGINIQFVQNSKHLTLVGWSGFELVVDARKNPTDSSTRQFLTAGVVVDELKGRVYFPVSGDIVAGKYYFNARCVTPAGERFTFMRGNYQVVDSIP